MNSDSSTPLAGEISAAAEGKRAAAMVEDLPFFVTDVACGDSVAMVERAGAEFVSCAPNAGVVMLSAGPKRLVVHARVPAPLADFRGCAYRLIAEALKDVPHVVQDKATDVATTAIVYEDASTGRDPWADKDTARAAVADYMNDEGLFGSDDEDDSEDDSSPAAGNPQ